jgi:hypothetical protein
LPATPTDCQEPPEHGRPMRLGWAKLLKWVFNDLGLTHCPYCGGQLRVVAAILQRQATDKILNHLEVDPQPSPRAPAHGQAVLGSLKIFNVIFTILRFTCKLPVSNTWQFALGVRAGANQVLSASQTQYVGIFTASQIVCSLYSNKKP